MGVSFAARASAPLITTRIQGSMEELEEGGAVSRSEEGGEGALVDMEPGDLVGDIPRQPELLGPFRLCRGGLAAEGAEPLGYVLNFYEPKGSGVDATTRELETRGVDHRCLCNAVHPSFVGSHLADTAIWDGDEGGIGGRDQEATWGDEGGGNQGGSKWIMGGGEVGGGNGGGRRGKAISRARFILGRGGSRLREPPYMATRRGGGRESGGHNLLRYYGVSPCRES